MKVTLEYDEMTGELKDNGVYIATAPPGMSFSKDMDKDESKVKDLTSLKDAGFSANEIMQMKREGLI